MRNRRDAARELDLSGQIDPERIAHVREQLLAWYRSGHRDLPWRRTRDPYAVLVSEVMLQQTQAERVVPKYLEFIDRFPTVQRLAAASTAEVIGVWAGLGYNRRAVYLQRAARLIVEQHGGQIPRDRVALERLPGVGRYTAGAVLCFAFGEDVGFWDTNIARVLHRVFVGPDVPARRLTARQLDLLTEQLVPPGRAYDWNQALIELGAVRCSARRPACGRCPIRTDCRAFPDIRALLDGLPRGARLKREPPFTGSTRYFRGRVIAYLREAPASGIDLLTLGARLRPDFTPAQLPWLEQLVDGLARDGLVLAEERATYDTGGARQTIVRLP